MNNFKLGSLNDFSILYNKVTTNKIITNEVINTRVNIKSNFESNNDLIFNLDFD